MNQSDRGILPTDNARSDAMFGRAVTPIRYLRTLYQLVRRYPVLPVIIAIGLAIMAIFAPWVAPNHPLESELEKLAAPPVWLEGGSWDYILGADKIGPRPSEPHHPRLPHIALGRIHRHHLR